MTELSELNPSARQIRRGILIDLLLIAVVLVVAYSRVIFTHETFRAIQNVDWLFLTQPAYVFTGKALARGEFPLWNSLWFSGYPHFAVPSNSMLYPTTILFGLLPFAAAAKIVVLLHTYLFGALSYALGRDMFEKRASAIFLGVCGIIGGLITWGIEGGQLWMVATLAWMPLAFLLLRRILITGRTVFAVLLVPVYALMLIAGDPQTMSFIYLWFGAYTAAALLIRLVSRDSPFRAVFARGLLALLAVVAGVGIAAVQIVPSRELMQESIRGGGVVYSFLRGVWRGEGLPFAYFHDIFGEIAPERFFIPGKVTVGLIVVALFGRAYREVVALWFATVVCVLYGNLPRQLYDSVVQYIPVYNSMRGAVRIVGVIIFILQLIAAYGLDNLLRSAGASRAIRVRWWGAAAVAVTATGCALVQTPDYSALAVPITLVFVTMVLFVTRYPQPHRGIAASMVVLLACELLPNFTRFIQTEPDKVYEITPEYAEFSSDHRGLARVFIADASPASIHHGQGTGMLTGDRMVDGSHGLFLQRFSKFFTDVGGWHISSNDEEGRLATQGPYVPNWITKSSMPLFDLFGVRYILRFGRPIPYLEAAVRNRPDMFELHTYGELNVYENRGAMPPLFPIHEVVPVESDDAALELIASGTLEYRHQATVPAGTAISPLSPATGAEPMVLDRYDSGVIEGKATLTAPALLVLTEMWYPDWYAQVDDGPLQPVIPVDTVFQGVFVPEGEHAIRFVYRPKSVRNGLILSVASMVVWLGCVGGLIAVRRRKRQISDADQTAIEEARPES